jgi:hypothetical protein
MKKILVLLAALATASPAFAAQAVAASVEELARASDVVVRGRVVSTTARWSDGRIYTYAEVEVSDSLRGSAPARVTVVTPGGEVGDLGQRVDGAAIFTSGEEVVVFLGKPQAGRYRVSGLAQGKFAIEGKVATPSLGRVDFVSSQVRVGERRAEAMSVGELESRVRSVK